MEAAHITARLEGLQRAIHQWLYDGRSRYYDPALVGDLFDRFTRLADQLRADHPDLFDDLPVRPGPTIEGTDNDGRGFIRRIHLETLQVDVEYCLNVLGSDALTDVHVPSMTVGKQGIFFAGEYFDAFRTITSMFAEAKKSIDLIDGYIDQRVLDRFTEKAPAVTVGILTKKVTPAIVQAGQAFNKQHGGLSIRTGGSFHDRFLIVDEHDYYTLGASVKDAGRRGFMFSRIEEPELTQQLGKKFATEWAAATIAVSP